MSEKPSVGRIVHYRSSTGNECLAAMVIWVGGGEYELVNLHVYYRDGGQASRFAVKEGTESGDWHWPERTGGPVTSEKIYLTGEQ